MRNIEFSRLRQLGRHFFAIPLIFMVLALIRYPYFINSDYFFTADEGMMANGILNILNGGPISFYYDYGRTVGLTFAFASVPLMWVLGPTALAFHLTATLFYSLYLWTTYLIARTLVPRTAYLVMILMFFTPPYITLMSTLNWPHIPAAFFGNLIFLLFIKWQLSEKRNSVVIFFLFFTIGLAIYTYTFSTIYVFTIGILYVLAHPRWDKMRGKMSLRTLMGVLKNKRTKRETICQLLDIVILLFFVAVGFSYIFGGFGLDIADYSILQINKFHKAAIQLLVLIFLRILINPKGSMSLLFKAKSYFAAIIQSDKKQMVVVGAVGFLIGLSPRIASILIGETSRGGQGHDFDFLPTKVLIHLKDLFILHGSKLFGFDKPFLGLISNPIDIYWSIVGGLFVALLAIFFISIVYFISENRFHLKKIIALRGMQFKAVHIILLAPVLVCFANITTQNGPMPRYLFPMFGILTLWIVIYVDKVKKKVKWLPLFVLAIWISFYSLANYRAYQNEGIIEDGKPIKFEKHHIYDVIEFLKARKISVAYSDYGISELGSFLSGGEINISEYTKHKAMSSSRKARSMHSPHFAIIAMGSSANIYRNYLQEKRIKFKNVTIAKREIFWDFAGDDAEINNLRSLIDEIPPSSAAG